MSAGALWREVVEAVSPHGLAVMHGSSPTVGVIGYLLDGGLSFYARKHGLADNHVVGFDVVTADGALRRVDAQHNLELFFALRGGGGASVVVCSVDVGLLSYSQITGGAVFYSAADVSSLLRVWSEWARTASPAIPTTFRRLNLPVAPQVPDTLRGVPTVCIDAVDGSAGGVAAADLEHRLDATAAHCSWPSCASSAAPSPRRRPMPARGVQ